MSLAFVQEAAKFEEHLFAPETAAFDPLGVHTEFNQGLHGRKMDMDQIGEGTPLYEDWIHLHTHSLALRYPKGLLKRTVLVGTANGTNRIARDTALELDCGAIAVETIKNDGPEGLKVELTDEAITTIRNFNPLLAKVMEDAATRGTNSTAAVVSTHQHRPKSLQEIGVENAFERGTLEWLVQLGIPFHSLVIKHMKDLTAKECMRRGPCADGWYLKPYKGNGND